MFCGYFNRTEQSVAGICCSCTWEGATHSGTRNCTVRHTMKRTQWRDREWNTGCDKHWDTHDTCAVMHSVTQCEIYGAIHIETDTGRNQSIAKLFCVPTHIKFCLQFTHMFFFLNTSSIHNPGSKYVNHRQTAMYWTEVMCEFMAWHSVKKVFSEKIAKQEQQHK